MITNNYFRVYRLKAADLQWLAGYLEGEGCFRLEFSNNGQRRYPLISISTSDYDVALKVADLLQAVSVRSMGKPKKSHWKQCYSVRVQTWDLVPLLKRLRPLMGQRRQAAIDEILAAESHG
jgi:LAGLIDADG-like domain